MNKKELVKVVAETNKIIAATTPNNASENISNFLNNMDILLSNMVDIHLMRKKGRFLWFFVKEETEEECVNFLRTIRNVEEKKGGNTNVSNDFAFIKAYENRLSLNWLW